MTSPVRVSYAHGVSLVPLLGQTIAANLGQTVARHPDADALVMPAHGCRLSYRRLWDETTDVARGLLALGVRPGDRVGVWSVNRPEWVLVQYASARVGAVLVNVNPAYQAPELEYALNWSGVAVLFLAGSFRGAPYAPMLEAVRPRCPELRHVVRFDHDWGGFLRGGAAADAAAVDRISAGLQWDDPINIQYTSGTTGLPKGATLTHHNLVNNAHFVAQALGYTPRDRVCIPVPFYHCFGMVLGNLACTASGACMVVPSETFDPAAVLRAVAAEGCTSLYGVPTMFRAVLEQPDLEHHDRSTLRTGIMAGSPCPIELMRAVIDRLHMPEIAIGYGMTETSPLSTLSARDDPLDRRVGTVGRVLPHVEVCIKDAGGTVVPCGTPGEFCARGYHVMRNYWRDEAATARAIDDAGWMHSGDLATLDESGAVRIVGRLKDLIIRGGENISPAEIEATLHAHPAVSEAQVVGVPSRKYGEEVVAFVRPAPGRCCTEAELAEHCRSRLARFKVPRFWQFVEAFPLTVTGKVQKFKLREMAVDLLGRQADAAERTA